MENSQQPASFDGKLQKFQYAHVASSSSGITRRTTRSGAVAARSVVQDPKARVTKPSSPKKKTKRATSKYAPPSKYAHLKPLTDILEPNLILVFVGFNPGVQTATAGHAYAHKSNLFWRLLHWTGLTDRRLEPEEDVNLPKLYAMGNTNLVSRPSKDVAELSKEEQEDAVPVLDAKIRLCKPEAVCIVGKSIWENIWKYRYGSKPGKAFKYGWQDEGHNMGKLSAAGEDEDSDKDWAGARVFVATATSGLAASTTPTQKREIWQPLGDWVQQRRRERLEAVAGAETMVEESNN